MSNLSEKISVLIVDDSFFIRKVLKHLIDGQPDMFVVGEAGDGEEAILLARKLKPRVITMDYHLPKKNGLEATGEIMLSVVPAPGVLIVSAFSGSDGQGVLESLKVGAVDYIEKPSGELSLDMSSVSRKIVDKIRAIGVSSVRMNRANRHAQRKQLIDGNHSVDRHSRIVVIGASTGGPPIIEDILEQLPTNLGFSIIVVQHMSKYFTSIFAERFDRIGGYRVKEATDGDILEQNHVYVAPGDAYVTVKNVPDTEEFILEVVPKTALESQTESDIDVVLFSVAEVARDRSLGIVLTGMGSDGALGLTAIVKEGGVAFIQEPSSAVVGSMPKSARSLVTLAHILLPEDIVPQMIQLATFRG